MTEKPRGKPPVAQDEPGHLGVDDRGNTGWEWKDDHDLLADDSLGAAERMRVLVDPKLEVKDEEVDPMSPAQNNPKGLRSGYNPYNSGALGKQSWKKKRNLRQLSEWIELRKRMSDKKDPDGE
jgi:hypothetical protein